MIRNLRLIHKLLLGFWLAAIVPVLFLGFALKRELERSLRESAMRRQEAVARQSAEWVREYMENVAGLLAILRGGADLRDPRRRGPALETLLDNGPMFSELALFDVRGLETYRLSRSSDRGRLSLRVGSSVWKELEKKSVCFGPVDFSIPRQPAVTFYALLESLRGRTAGVLAGKINLLDLSIRMQKRDWGEGAALTVTDDQNRFLAWSIKDEPAGGPPVQPRSTPMMTIHVPIHGTPWVATLEQPEKVVFALERRARTRVGWALLVAFFFALGLGYGMARSLVRPLTAIGRAIGDLVEGRFHSPLAPRSNDEIGMLTEKLREAQKALEVKVRQSTVGMLMHRLGHDMRQPLIAIRECVAAAKPRATLDPRLSRAFEAMEQEVQQGIDWIEELLTLGRQRPPRLSPVPLMKIVRKLLERTPSSPGITVQAHGDDFVVCRVDADEVQRGLANALRNAFESGARNVSILVQRESDKGWIRVIDDGSGVSREDQSKVFHDFFTTKPNGTGLGLGIIKNVTERSGGSVTLTNNEVKGATLTFIFPLCAADV